MNTFLFVVDLAALREVGAFKGNDVSNGQATTASTSGLSSSLAFSSRPSSCLKQMPQIAENGNESLEENCDQSRILVDEDGNSKFCIPSFTSEIWESSSFNAPKTESDDEIMFSSSNGLESQVHNKVCEYTFNQLNFELFSTVDH